MQTVKTTRIPLLALLVLSASPWLWGCGDEPNVLRPGGKIDFEPDRPDLVEGNAATEYTGTDPYVLEAQQTHRTGLELYRNVITRTCGPTGGVCHNKQGNHG